MRCSDSRLLIDNMHEVIADVERLLRSTAGDASEAVRHARVAAEESVAAARRKLLAAEHELIDGARDAKVAAVRFARSHPWPLIGLAATFGVIVGVLVSRR